MGDQYITGQAGAVGPGAVAHDLTFSQLWSQQHSAINLGDLASELVTLRAALRERANEPEDDLAIAEVSYAQIAATKGDGEQTLSHLARAGKWALGVAGSIGTMVAAAAIKASLGI